jgi:hypothetical protein
VAGAEVAFGAAAIAIALALAAVAAIRTSGRIAPRP